LHTDYSPTRDPCRGTVQSGTVYSSATVHSSTTLATRSTSTSATVVLQYCSTTVASTTVRVPYQVATVRTSKKKLEHPRCQIVHTPERAGPGFTVQKRAKNRTGVYIALTPAENGSVLALITVTLPVSIGLRPPRPVSGKKSRKKRGFGADPVK
jgi:hypothetical protein